MKIKFILVFIGFFIFQITTQNNFLNNTIILIDFYEESGDESKHKEEVKQDFKITNIIVPYPDHDFFISLGSDPLHFQINIVTTTYKSVETPPPNVVYIFAPAA